ncbi:MAG: hypothetical protein C0456_19275 [Hyphomonas sp.]|uniref:hypothetical protein n=1 Tax=Hyphomonas sp. TaxID=87 RepID=UPI001D5BEA52|nr:hypothetical protein [Hyphomonas sp.]MBA4228750.1 hypothetical protein [Hyphomonas sp.]
MSNTVERPTGDNIIVVGWLCLVGSGLAGGLGMLQAKAAQNDLSLASEVTSYYAEKAQEGLAQAALASTASWTLFYMFIAFICTGYIVRALSFLPGKEEGQ